MLSTLCEQYTSNVVYAMAVMSPRLNYASLTQVPAYQLRVRVLDEQKGRVNSPDPATAAAAADTSTRAGESLLCPRACGAP